MTIRNIIEAVRADLEYSLSVFFDAFIIGYPDNQDKLLCCVRLAAMKGKEDFEFIVHLALPGVSEAESYAYIEAMREYMDGHFDPVLYGYDEFTWDLQVFETEFTRGDIQALISVTMSRVSDDCQ